MILVVDYNTITYNGLRVWLVADKLITNFIKMEVQKEISLRNAISYCIENNDVNTSTNRIMEFIRDEKEAINFIPCCKIDSEQFSFADMRDAFDYASVSAQRRDGMTFKEWMSKR
jgi:hypothetical protein